MRQLRAVSFLVSASAFALSCSGVAPSTPSTDAPDITMVVTQPAPGATLAPRCPAGRTVCTDQLALTFNVRFDRTVPDASVLVEFYTSTNQRCAIAMTPRVTLQAGVSSPATSAITLLSSPPDFIQFCELPVTTTRIVATLMDATEARLLTREFAANYTFASPAAAH
jgi:hypothetical protein